MKILYALLIFVPIAIVARLLSSPPIVVFVLAALAIVPLSGVMGAATESVAEHTTPAIGGVLSATMGNLAELIIASVALRAGLIDLVKASITGSILGNLLLVLGIALFAGGLKFKVQKFNRNLAGHSTTVLLIAVFGLVVPALFHSLHPDPERVATVRMVSEDRVDPLYEATVQATEEAIINAMLAARTMTGADWYRVPGLPHDRLRAVLARHERLLPR